MESPSSAAARDSFAKTLRLATLTFLAFGAIAVLVYIVLSWRQAREEMKNNLAIQASFAAASSQDFFDKIGINLAMLGHMMVREGFPDDREAGVSLLTVFESRYPEIASMVLFRPDGQMLANTFSKSKAALPDLRRHPAFLRALEEDIRSRNPYSVGRTQKGLVLNQWRIPIRHVVRGPDGRPLFVIQATILAKQQADLWQAIPLYPGTSIGLLRDDRYQQSRWPATDLGDLYNKRFTGPLVQAIRRQPAKGFYQGTVQSDGSDRIGAYVRVPRLNMTAYVSVPMTLLWSHWLDRNFLVFFGILVYFTFFIAVAKFISQLEEKHSRALLSQARRDPLTDLPNRLAAEEALAREIAAAQRDSGSIAILFFDLDRFKDINDSLGHAVGDQVLVEIAELLKRKLRETDILARLGGDEFLAILPDTSASQAREVAQRILSALSETLILQEHHFQISTSIGISLFPHDGDNAGVLLKCADAAMYEAKRQGRSHVALFSHALSENSRQRLQLQQDLQRALARGEFVLHYQPLIELAGGRIIGAEALIRWQDPERGMRYPGEFIQYAEESGLILPIGQWVLEAACHQAQHWAERGMDLTVTANLSTRQFQDPDLPVKLRDILALTRLDPRRLELEITESAAMLDPEASLRTMSALKRLGLMMAIDDFGTGYSSLSYLKRIPADTIKIDQSFVRDLAIDPEDAAIVRAIIGLAKTLGRNCLAEGIESAEHLQILQTLHCDYGQGFHISPPLPAEDFEAFFHEQRSLSAGIA